LRRYRPAEAVPFQNQLLPSVELPNANCRIKKNRDELCASSSRGERR